jgi:hypothetical protein
MGAVGSVRVATFTGAERVADLAIYSDYNWTADCVNANRTSLFIVNRLSIKIFG